MKKISILLFAIAISGSAFAQKGKSSDTTVHKTEMKDGIMNKGGKIWYIKRLTATMSLENGVEANTDGTVKISNGKTLSLSDGDCINFQGQLVGLNQRNSSVDGLVMRNNGIMWVWSILNKPLLLKNGTYAMPDGTLKTQDGKYVKVKDKEFIDLDGNASMMSK